MIAKQPMSRLRSLALTVALFAVTLAVSQPLAHAVMLRAGGLETAIALWGSLCGPNAEKDEAGSQSPTKAKVHECCFGLAHAPALALPSSASNLAESGEVPQRVHAALHHPSAGAIRDGPNQPRAPPLPKT